MPRPKVSGIADTRLQNRVEYLFLYEVKGSFLLILVFIYFEFTFCSPAQYSPVPVQVVRGFALKRPSGHTVVTGVFPSTPRLDLLV